MVLIHGLSVPSIMWKHVAPELARKGMRVLVYGMSSFLFSPSPSLALLPPSTIARCFAKLTRPCIDLYGRGYTDGPEPPTQYTTGLYTTQLALLMQYVRWDEGADVIVGLSMVRPPFALRLSHKANVNTGWSYHICIRTALPRPRRPENCTPILRWSSHCSFFSLILFRRCPIVGRAFSGGPFLEKDEIQNVSFHAERSLYRFHPRMPLPFLLFSPASCLLIRLYKECALPISVTCKERSTNNS